MAAERPAATTAELFVRPSFEGVVRFADGGCAAVARLDAESFEAAAGQIIGMVSRPVRRIELTDLRYEDAEAHRASNEGGA